MLDIREPVGSGGTSHGCCANNITFHVGQLFEVMIQCILKSDLCTNKVYSSNRLILYPDVPDYVEILSDYKSD